MTPCKPSPSSSLTAVPSKVPDIAQIDSSSTKVTMSLEYRQDDERATFLHEYQLKSIPSKGWRNRTAYIITVCNVILLIISTSLFSTWFFETHMRLNPHFRHLSSYTPLLNEISLHFNDVRLNGTLYHPKKSPSLARQKPSPAVDAIWEEWELTRVLPITASQIRAMGKDPSTAVKLEDAIWGLGDDAYASIFDVYHQAHCLNTLRKLVYPDYYTRHSWQHSADPRAMFEIHMEHCIDILLQAIQCSGNLNLITMHWVETEPYPFPDMSVNKKCIDFESLTEWRKSNTVDLEKFNQTMDKPEGVKQLKQADGYYKYFRPEWENPNHKDGANSDVDFNL